MIVCPAVGLVPFPATVTTYFNPLPVVTSSPIFTSSSPPADVPSASTIEGAATDATVAAVANPTVFRYDARLCWPPVEEAEHVRTLRAAEVPAVEAAARSGRSQQKNVWTFRGDN